MSLDPVVTNADHYTLIFENDRVRVLEYSDQPGRPHDPA
jgi:beta-alanine degradation protein BauB